MPKRPRGRDLGTVSSQRSCLGAEWLDRPDLDVGVLFGEGDGPVCVVDVPVGVNEPNDGQVAVSLELGDRLRRRARRAARVDGDDAGVAENECERRPAVPGGDEHPVGQTDEPALAGRVERAEFPTRRRFGPDHGANGSAAVIGGPRTERRRRGPWHARSHVTVF